MGGCATKPKWFHADDDSSVPLDKPELTLSSSAVEVEEKGGGEEKGEVWKEEISPEENRRRSLGILFQENDKPIVADAGGPESKVSDLDQKKEPEGVVVVEKPMIGDEVRVPEVESAMKLLEEKQPGSDHCIKSIAAAAARAESKVADSDQKKEVEGALAVEKPPIGDEVRVMEIESAMTLVEKLPDSEKQEDEVKVVKEIEAVVKSTEKDEKTTQVPLVESDVTTVETKSDVVSSVEQTISEESFADVDAKLEQQQAAPREPSSEPNVELVDEKIEMTSSTERSFSEAPIVCSEASPMQEEKITFEEPSMETKSKEVEVVTTDSSIQQPLVEENPLDVSSVAEVQESNQEEGITTNNTPTESETKVVEIFTVDESIQEVVTQQLLVTGKPSGLDEVEVIKVEKSIQEAEDITNGETSLESDIKVVKVPTAKVSFEVENPIQQEVVTDETSGKADNKNESQEVNSISEPASLESQIDAVEVHTFQKSLQAEQPMQQELIAEEPSGIVETKVVEAENGSEVEKVTEKSSVEPVIKVVEVQTVKESMPAEVPTTNNDSPSESEIKVVESEAPKSAPAAYKTEIPEVKPKSETMVLEVTGLPHMENETIPSATAVVEDKFIKDIKIDEISNTKPEEVVAN